MVSVFGSVAGALLLYSLARWVGVGLLERMAAWLRARRLLPKMSTTPSHLGFLTIVQSRLVPGLALPTSIGAGLTRTSLSQFISGVIVSEAIFITPIVAVGFAVGATTGDFDSLAQRIPLVIGALAAAVISVRLLWRLKRAAQSQQTADLP
jgi:membrane protein DedA with SNARE-associated domain